MAEVIHRFSKFEEQYEQLKDQFLESEEECPHEGTYFAEDQREERMSSTTRTITIEALLLSTHDLFTNSGGIV